eukprot:ctg_1633.g516
MFSAGRFQGSAAVGNALDRRHGARRNGSALPPPQQFRSSWCVLVSSNTPRRKGFKLRQSHGSAARGGVRDTEQRGQAAVGAVLRRAGVSHRVVPTGAGGAAAPQSRCHDGGAGRRGPVAPLSDLGAGAPWGASWNGDDVEVVLLPG